MHLELYLSSNFGNFTLSVKNLTKVYDINE